MRKLLAQVVLLCVLLSSCTKSFEKMEPNIYLDLSGSRGVYIGCEGNLMFGNASLSYYNKDSKASYSQMFFNTNGFPIGDVLQSTKIRGNKIYMMINGSGKIFIADKNTLQYSDKIAGLVSPRYIEFIDDKKAYISDLYSPAMAVLDLTTNKVSKSILIGYSPTGAVRGTEEMIRYNDFIFTSSWSFGNKVYKIDTRQDKVVDSLTVTTNPNSLALDKNNKLWVLSDGGYEGTPAGKEIATLTRIDAESFAVEQVMTFSDSDIQPRELKINSADDTLYFVYGVSRMLNDSYGIYKMSVDDVSLPTKAYILAGEKLIHSLGIDPENEDIYVGDAVDYIQKGIIYRYSKEGTQIDKFFTGIIPGSFTFKTDN